MTQLLKSGTKQLLESQEAQRLQTQTDSFLLSENTTEQMTVIFLCSYQEGKYAERHRNIEESKRDGEPHLYLERTVSFPAGDPSKMISGCCVSVHLGQQAGADFH